MHQPKADVVCLYLPRIDGGRGLIQLEIASRNCKIYIELINE